MHILFLIYNMGGGGAERFTATMANHWAKQGHQVSIVTLANTSQSVYPLRSDIYLTSVGINRETSSLRSGIGNSVRRVWRIRQVLKHLKPDVAIGIMTTSSCLLALAGRGLNIRLIGAERSYPPALSLGRAWQLMRHVAYHCLDAVVAQTEEGAAWLRANTWAKRVVALSNPVALPLPVTEPRLEPGAILPAGTKMLLAVGRLSNEKQLHLLIDSFAVLAALHPDWQLVILGEGPMRPALEAQLRTSCLAGRVHLPGRVGNPGDWMLRAELTVMTSAFEGFPNALLEAMAYGTPGVSFDCKTGPAEIIRPGLNGMLVPERNIQRLTDTLGALMQDPERRARMAGEALKLQITFGLDEVSEAWIELLKG